jgi:hypothetical protein
MKEFADVAAAVLGGSVVTSLAVLALLVVAVTGCARYDEERRMAKSADFFVAPNGDDAWSGKLAKPNRAGTDGPFATITRARDAVRQARAAGGEPRPYRVLVRGGVYRLTEPIVFGPQDSGQEGAPVLYAAYPGEKPVFSGGRPITGWKKGKGAVWTAEIPEVKAGKWYFHQLFVNGRRAVRARTPNEGYLRTEGPLPEIKNPHKERKNPKAKMGFQYKPGDLKPWDNLEDVNLFVYHSWTASLNWIAALDEQEHVVHFTAPSNWPIGWWERKQRYVVENYLEALDSPGEWYLDRKTGLLHYWPREGEDMTKAEVVAPVLGDLVRILGEPQAGLSVEHVVLRGLSFQHADWLLPRDKAADGQAAAFLSSAAVYVRGARQVAFEDCEIAHIGGYALWFATGSQHCRAVKCHIHDLGAGGVRIGETSSPKKKAEAAEHNLVDNCFIHDGGHVFPAGIGVWIGRSSHNTVSHNEICDFYYSGTSIGWSWGYAKSTAHDNILEHNHIHHLGLGVLSDMGGIYTLGQSQGTVIRHNCFHDIYSYSYGGWGLYTDEGSTDILMENNIVYNTKTGGFHQHYGKNNLVRNNILALCRQGQIQRSREEDHISFTLERNIVYCSNDQVLSSNWRNGNDRLDHNLYWVTTGEEPELAGRDFEEWQATGQDKHSLVADPKFVAPEKYDFRLQPDSPALKLGFQPIDPSTIGLYGEREWVNLPKRFPNRPIPPDDTPKPQTIDDDFEDTAAGEPAKDARTSGEEKGASIRVTNETAATGKHSLKFTDAPGLSREWQPHLFYQPRVHKGAVRMAFDLRIEPAAICWHEWRGAGHPYLVGPSLRVEKDGRLVVGGKSLMTLPHSQWVHFQIDCTLGRKTAGTYALTVTVKGQKPRKLEKLAFGSEKFRKLRWIGFISLATEKAVFYLDNLKLERVDK